MTPSAHGRLTAPESDLLPPIVALGVAGPALRSRLRWGGDGRGSQQTEQPAGGGRQDHRASPCYGSWAIACSGAANSLHRRPYRRRPSRAWRATFRILPNASPRP